VVGYGTLGAARTGGKAGMQGCVLLSAVPVSDTEKAGRDMTRLYSGNKYRNVKSGGYHSKKESNRSAELKFLQSIGEIRNLQEQVRYEIIPANEDERAAHYVADFEYTTLPEEELVVEDVKSSFTRKNPVYILKRKLMRHIYGIKIKEA
jgi:hypothetical protein